MKGENALHQYDLFLLSSRHIIFYRYRIAVESPLRQEKNMHLANPLGILYRIEMQH